LTQQELLFVELYQNRQEDDTKRLLLDYLASDKRIVSKHYSSITRETQPLVTQETYILPQNVKKIAMTETASHVTGRSLVVVTNENQVLSLKDIQLTSRRPLPVLVEEDPWEKLKEELKEAAEDKPAPIKLKLDTLPKYEPVQPINFKRYHSYDLVLVGLEDVVTLPTQLESTTQIFVHGHDLFLARVTPDNAFDLLDEDFSFTLLFATIAFCIVADIVLSVFQKRRTLMREFLTR
jgi:hypothetical protein